MSFLSEQYVPVVPATYSKNLKTGEIKYFPNAGLVDDATKTKMFEDRANINAEISYSGHKCPHYYLRGFRNHHMCSNSKTILNKGTLFNGSLYFTLRLDSLIHEKHRQINEFASKANALK